MKVEYNKGNLKESINKIQPFNIIDLFETQVSMYPNKTAVIACDRTLTYLELNE